MTLSHFQRYIPGMEGAVRPDEPMTVERERQLHEQQKDAYIKLQVKSV